MLPLFLMLFLVSILSPGLPERVPAAIVDMDHSAISRQTTQTLDAMQMVDIVEADESYTEARHKMQEGKIFGYFLIPRHFQEDLLAGRTPSITFYTNMTYYVPASLLYKTFKTTAVYLKAGVVMQASQTVGIDTNRISGLLLPINVVTRPIGNPWLNYAYYLCNSFVPGCLQLMILLMTTFTLGQNVKYGRSRLLMKMGDGSIVKVLFGVLAPQTIIWIVEVLFMTSWMYGWNHFPMHGSWTWFITSQVMYVLACQAFGVFIFGVVPNLRLSLSISALLGILTFSIAAYSFPVESMYPAMGVFSWIIPARYNFLIYIDQALNGIDIYYSRWWYVAYIIFMMIPFTLLPRIKKAYCKPVYVP